MENGTLMSLLQMLASTFAPASPLNVEPQYTDSRMLLPSIPPGTMSWSLQLAPPTALEMFTDDLVNKKPGIPLCDWHGAKHTEQKPCI